MNNHERRRYDMFVRVDQFGKENANDFPAASVGAIQFAEVAAVIALIDQLAAAQATGSGSARMSFINKDTARENVREAVSEIARTARSMNYQIEGISAKFRMPPSLGDQSLLAAARSFLTETDAHKADFVAYGLNKDFLKDLQADITQFEQSLGSPVAAKGEQVEATAKIGETVRRGMVAVRILDGVVKNKYRRDVGKLAAWTTASHIEKSSAKSDQATSKKAEG